MKKYKSIPLVLISMIVLIFVSACTKDEKSNSTEKSVTSSKDAIEWNMQSSWTPGLEIQRQADSFAQKVGEMSGGRLKINSLPSGSIVGGLEVFDAAENGVIDVGYSASFYWVGNEPAAPFFAAVPAGLSAIEYIMWLYHGDGLELWQEMYKDYNFGYAGPAGINNTEIFAWSNKPIKSLDDFKGLKFRTVGYWGEILTKLGASVITLPGSEIYGALDRGVIDAAEFANPEADYGSALYEVAKYAHVPGIHQPTSLMEMVINKESWEALSPDLQAIVREAAKATTIEGLGNSMVKDSEALDLIKEAGVEIVKLSPELMSEIADIAHDLYEEKSAKDPFFKKVYESQMKYKAIYENLQSYMEINY